MEKNDYLQGTLTYDILGCAYEVHRVLGPGLLESAYRACMERELRLRGIPYRAEAAVPIQYKDEPIDNGYRADLIVDDRVLVELKAMERLLPIHNAQLTTYLHLSGIEVGLLINFNVSSLKNGIKRIVRRARSTVSVQPRRGNVALPKQSFS